MTRGQHIAYAASTYMPYHFGILTISFLLYFVASTWLGESLSMIVEYFMLAKGSIVAGLCSGS